MSMSGVQVLLMLLPIQHLPLTHQLHGSLPSLEGMSKDRTWNANVYGQNGISGNEEISFPKRRHYNKTKRGKCLLFENILSGMQGMLQFLVAGKEMPSGYQEENVGMEVQSGGPLRL